MLPIYKSFAEEGSFIAEIEARKFINEVPEMVACVNKKTQLKPGSLSGIIVLLVG
jgi:hypothetical protein